MSSEVSTGSFGIGAISPLARSIGGEPARRCRSDALLLTSVRSRVSILSSARLPDAATAAGFAIVVSGRAVSTRGAAAATCATGVGEGAGGAAGFDGAVLGLVPFVDAPFGWIRATIFPFCVSATSNVPSADEYSKLTAPFASRACGLSAGAISRTSVRIWALVSACFITGRAESLMVTVATSPSARMSAEALLVFRRLRKRSSWAISVQWTNTVNQRTIDQPRFV
jgi:hypothetical protein